MKHSMTEKSLVSNTFESLTAESPWSAAAAVHWILSSSFQSTTNATWKMKIQKPTDEITWHSEARAAVLANGNTLGYQCAPCPKTICKFMLILSHGSWSKHSTFTAASQLPEAKINPLMGALSDWRQHISQSTTQECMVLQIQPQGQTAHQPLQLNATGGKWWKAASKIKILWHVCFWLLSVNQPTCLSNQIESDLEPERAWLRTIWHW